MKTLTGDGSDTTGEIVAREVTPKVYVSYVGEPHERWVEALATRLRTEHHINATIDKWQLVPGDQEPEYLEQTIRESTFVVLICTPEYAELFDRREKRVG